MEKLGCIVLACAMFITNVSVMYGQEKGVRLKSTMSVAEEENEIKSVEPQNIISLPSVAEQFGVDEKWVFAELKKGYELHHIYEGLQLKQQGGSYESLMQQRYPTEKSIAPADVNHVGEKAEVYAALHKKKKEEKPVVLSEKNSRKKRSTSQTTYDELALRQKELRFDQAPYTVGDEQASISTMDGSLHIEEVDLVLPGANGMNFELRRKYDSSLGKNQTYYDWDDSKNRTTKLAEDDLFPLGKGWIWDIPYIKNVLGNKYIYIPKTGTYELEDHAIMGYPFDDLFIEECEDEYRNDTKNILRDMKTGWSYYFSSSGQLQRIIDPYHNKIEFGYQWGKLSSIITDTGDNKPGNRKRNCVWISYPDNEVEVQMHYQDPSTKQAKTKTVTYRKTKIEMDGEKKEILDEVIDAAGRSTKYFYDRHKNMLFNFLPWNSIEDNDFDDRMIGWGWNEWVTVSLISYPTKAQMQFDKEVVLRKIGPFAQEYQVRYKKKRQGYKTILGEGILTGETKLTFHQDIGDKFGDWAWKVSVDDGRKVSVYDYTIDYEQNYSGLSTSYPMQFSRDIPLLRLQKMETKAGYERKVIKYDYNQSRYREELHNKPIKVWEMNYGSNFNSSSQTSTYQYDERGFITEETLPLQGTRRYKYELQQIEHPLYRNKYSICKLKESVVPVSTNTNVVTTYTYDEIYGGLKQVKVSDHTGKLLRQVNYERDRYGNATNIRLKGERGSDTVIEQQYDEAYNYMYLTSQKVKVRGVDGNETEYIKKATYNALTGDVYEEIDGKNQKTTYQYDDVQRVKKVKYADGTETNVTYDDKNNTVTVLNALGKQEIWQYDPVGRLVKERNSRGSAEHVYNSYGDLVRKGDYNGAITYYKYDAWGRPIAERTGRDLYYSIDYQYDDVKRTKTTTDEAGNEIRETFDDLGRLIRKEQVKPTGAIDLERYVYDVSGNVTQKTDGNGNTTNYTYDALGNLLSVTDAEGKTTCAQYDRAGNRIEVTYADQSKMLMKYNEVGQRIEQTFANGKKNQWNYDANGNITKMIDGKGQTHTYRYDARNRLIERTTGNENVTYTYDGLGRRTTMTDGTGTTKYTYTPMGELHTMTYAGGVQVNMEYEVRGLRTKQTITDGRKTLSSAVTYKRDYPFPNEVEIAGSNRIRYTYEVDKGKRLEKRRGSNGLSEHYWYDFLNVSKIEQRKGNEVALSYEYKYDNNRNLIEKMEAGKRARLSYDRLNRLKTTSEFEETYTYDCRDNRREVTSRKEKEVTVGKYKYDEWNRLTEVELEDGRVVKYRYNGDNLLVERREGENITRYYYDDKQQLIGEGKGKAGGRVKLTAMYGYDPLGKLLAREVEGKRGLQTYHLNGHGDVVEIWNAEKEVLNRYTYDVWGNVLTEEEEVENGLRYAGEYWDSTTKLQYLRARWYDPALGRFITEDTYEGKLTNPLSLNLYTYVENNPLLYVDPSGHVPEWVGQAWQTTKHLVIGVADFLLLDDVRVILNPKASKVDKGLATVSLLPQGKILKATKFMHRLGKTSKAAHVTKGTGNLNDLIKQKSVGKGSTGRTVPNNLREQLSMKEVLSNPLEVATQVPVKNMNDPRWLGSEGWTKMQRVVKTSKGKTTIHFNYNTKTGQLDDFKFKH